MGSEFGIEGWGVSQITNQKTKILGFRDLDVYQRSYNASIPRLIAEGYAKRNQLRGFQKYLVDALGECNEIQVSLNHCRDLYETYVDKKLCEDLDREYEIIGKQVYRLSESWSRVKGVVS